MRTKKRSVDNSTPTLDVQWKWLGSLVYTAFVSASWYDYPFTCNHGYAHTRRFIANIQKYPFGIFGNKRMNSRGEEMLFLVQLLAYSPTM